MFGSSPKYKKLQTNMRLSINRLKLLEKKKTEMAVKSRREVSEFLAAGKIDRAKIRVEHIIREDYLVEAMEIIEMYCDLLLARMGVIQSSKEVDEGLEEPIATIVWATPRLQSEVQELSIVSEQLTAKYGKEVAHTWRTNSTNKVNKKLEHKLGIQAPPSYLVEKYLEEIAKTYKISYTPDPAALEPPPVQNNQIGFENLIDLTNDGGERKGLKPLQPHHVQPLPDNPPAYPAQHGPGGAPAFTMPPAPAASSLYPAAQHQDNFRQPPPLPSQGPVASPPKANQQTYSDDTLPDLPSVPSNSTLPGGASIGGESVDFDDLNRRFEQLKKKK